MARATHYKQLPKSEADFRRYLTRVLESDAEAFLGHMRFLHLDEYEIARNGRDCVSKSEISAVVGTATEMIRRRQQESPQQWRMEVQKTKNRYKRGDPSHPSPDNFFGIGDCPEQTSFAVQVGVSDDPVRNEALTCAAIKLTEDYLAHKKEVRNIGREREKAEKDAFILNAVQGASRGKSAMSVADSIAKARAKKASRAGKSHGTSTAATPLRIVTTPKSPTCPKKARSVDQAWKTASEDEKAGWMAGAIHEGEGGLSITINLSPETVADAIRAKKGAMSHLRERLANLLRRRLGFSPDMLLIAEQSFRQGPHIHGVIGLPNTKENRKAIRSAGEVLSGKNLTSPGRARIVDIQALYDPKYWAEDYLSKYREQSKARFKSDRVVVYSRTLGQRGKQMVARQLEAQTGVVAEDLPTSSFGKSLT